MYADGCEEKIGWWDRQFSILPRDVQIDTYDDPSQARSLSATPLHPNQ